MNNDRMNDGGPSGGSGDARRYFEDLRQRRALAEAERPAVIEDGVDSLRRLVKLAQSDTGQCRKAALFVLGLYNGHRFPFDLTELRAVDEAIFIDCMRVLRMDARFPEREVHKYFENGGELFERLAREWEVRDHSVDAR